MRSTRSARWRNQSVSRRFESSAAPKTPTLMTSISPAPRSPGMVDRRAEVPASKSRKWLVRVGYALFGLAIFIAFVIATFPYSDTLSNLLTPHAMQITIGEQHLDFPFGAQLLDVRVTSLTNGAPVFESPAISVTPSF